MLSKELLRGPQPNGTVPPSVESCSPGPQHVLDYNPLSPIHLFYYNGVRLRDALEKIVAGHDGDESVLMSLSSRFLKILSVRPQISGHNKHVPLQFRIIANIFVKNVKLCK